MRAILGYVINMIPYMIIAIPIYLIVRFIYLKIKNKKLNWYHEIVLFLFVIFIVGLSSQTIIPKFESGVGGFKIIKSGIHETNLIPFKVLVETYNEVFVNGYINYFIINFLGNIILFMPFGFIIPLLWNVSNKKVIIIGFCSSLFIEICQLFLTRGTDVDDLILNTLGVLLGLLLYKLLYKKFNKYMDKFKSSTSVPLVSECDQIADDLLFKAIGRNKRTLELPLKVSYIKNYCLSSNINNNQIFDSLVWIALRLVAISYCIKYNDSLEKNTDN